MNAFFGVIYITFVVLVFMAVVGLAIAFFLPSQDLLSSFLSPEYLWVKLVAGVFFAISVLAMVFCGKFIAKQETLFIKQEEIVKTKHDSKGPEGRPLIVVFLTGRDYVYFVFPKPLEQEFAGLVLRVAKTSVH